MNTINTECRECSGTGLYSGFMEGNGQAVICVRCSGTGCQTISYKPFAGRKRRNGIKEIRYGSGMILDDTTRTKWMSYEDFTKAIPAPKV